MNTSGMKETHTHTYTVCMYRQKNMRYFFKYNIERELRSHYQSAFLFTVGENPTHRAQWKLTSENRRLTHPEVNVAFSPTDDKHRLQGCLATGLLRR